MCNVQCSKCIKSWFTMASLEELCDSFGFVYGLPPEIIVHIITDNDLQVCDICKAWNNGSTFLTCNDCHSKVCTDCEPRYCRWDCCFYCKTCSVRRYCPDTKDYGCQLHVNPSEYTCSLQTTVSGCRHCHVSHQCDACSLSFCCNHFIEFDNLKILSINDLRICFSCWDVLCQKVNQHIEYKNSLLYTLS